MPQARTVSKIKAGRACALAHREFRDCLCLPCLAAGADASLCPGGGRGGLGDGVVVGGCGGGDASALSAKDGIDGGGDGRSGGVVRRVKTKE